MARLRNLIALTERELSLLAVVVTEMTQSGHDPYNERYIIQIDPGLLSVFCELLEVTQR